MKKFMRLRLKWKLTIGAMLAVILVWGAIYIAIGDTSVNLSLNVSTLSITEGSTSTAIYTSTFSGTDDNYVDATDPSLNGLASVNRLVWTSSNSGVVALVDDDGDYVNTVEKTIRPTLYGASAGKATVTVSYHSRTYDENGSIATDTVVKSASASVNVPIEVEFYVTRGGMDVTNENYYEIGDIITITSNTSTSNPLFISTTYDTSGNVTSDGIVELVSSTYNSASLKVVGGGKTVITARTTDGEGVEALSKNFTCVGEVKFLEGSANANSQGHYIQTLSSGQKYMILDDTDFKSFTYETVPSNVTTPTSSGVEYKIDDTSIATVTAGDVCGVAAGVTKLSAGVTVTDVNGNSTWLTYDTVNIVVPFKKQGEETTTLNVEDQLQLYTSGVSSEVTWSTSNTSVLQVDASTGLVTATGAGTAIIYATRTQDELYTTYNQTYQLLYTITVIDDFGLSTTTATLNIGDSFDLKALVTNEVTKEDITYTITNQANDAGVVPTGDIVTVVQSDDGLTLKVTGASAGTTHIKVIQNINGVIKSDTCVVYVTTPVEGISINPSTIDIPIGTTSTVQLEFTPESPTNNTVYWFTSDSSVATVTGTSYTADITGVKGGTCTISVISQDGLYMASCTVNVTVAVTGVSLNATSVSTNLSVGQYQLVATVTPSNSDGVNKNVTWTSSNTSVATVDENGLVTFVSSGNVTIVCQTVEGGYLAMCNITIAIPVESITLNHTDEILSIGDTLTISATVLPQTATNREVSWSSTNTSVATVDERGVVTAVASGSATILCQSTDGTALVETCAIYVKQPITSIELTTTEITVRKGQVFWLYATVLPENADNKTLTWTSANSNLVTVDSDGKVTAVEATDGAAITITCTNDDTGLYATCKVTVTQPVTGITLNSSYQELWVGSKYAIIPTIEPTDAENKKVTYLSSDESVAKVDENGVVTAVAGGSCVIEVTTEECSLTAACNIVVFEYVSTVSLDQSEFYINVGDKKKINATVGADTATTKTVSWTSSNDSYCSVDSTGYITAISPGNVTITATAIDGSSVSASCVVHVVNPVTGISVSPSTSRILVGDSVILSAGISPSNATVQNVTWTSSDTSIATVDEQGEVIGVAAGKVKITATSTDGNGVKGVAWVYVTTPINITSLKINSSSIYMLNGKSRQLSVIVRPVTNTDAYSWYSSDTGIVTVNQNGLITTVGPGTAEVYVMSEGSSVEAKCTVHSLALSSTSITLEQYDSYYLTVIGNDEENTVTWRSTNPRVATVKDDGTIVARKAGTCTIKAIVDNKTLNCVVRVTNFR